MKLAAGVRPAAELDDGARAEQQIESLLDAFAFALLFVQRVDELADQRVQRGHIIRERRAFA